MSVVIAVCKASGKNCEPYSSILIKKHRKGIQHYRYTAGIPEATRLDRFSARGVVHNSVPWWFLSLTPGEVIRNVDNPPILVGHHTIVEHGKTERPRSDGGLDAVMSPSPNLETYNSSTTFRSTIRQEMLRTPVV